MSVPLFMAFLAATSLTLFAQSLPVATEPSALELKIIPDQGNGVPDGFTFELTNRADYDVRLPQPSVACTNSFDGWIQLRLKFEPFHPEEGQYGGGCAGDQLNWPDILSRIEHWRVLRPGESIRAHRDHAQLFYDHRKAGKYEFWAEYQPPFVSEGDAALLRNSGVKVSLVPVSSVHVRRTRTE